MSFAMAAFVSRGLHKRKPRLIKPPYDHLSIPYFNSFFLRLGILVSILKWLSFTPRLDRMMAGCFFIFLE